jgi:hypothetical protein
MVCQCLIDERMLVLQGLGGATTGLQIIIKRRIDDLREQLRNGPKPVRFMSIVSIERLSQCELAGVCIVAKIEPIGDVAPSVRERRMYPRSRGAAVNAPDDKIKIVAEIVAGAQMLRDGLPIEPPEQVQPVDKNDRLE